MRIGKHVPAEALQGMNIRELTDYLQSHLTETWEQAASGVVSD
jgi:hypothetical protein